MSGMVTVMTMEVTVSVCFIPPPHTRDDYRVTTGPRRPSQEFGYIRRQAFRRVSAHVRTVSKHKKYQTKTRRSQECLRFPSTRKEIPKWEKRWRVRDANGRAERGREHSLLIELRLLEIQPLLDHLELSLFDGSDPLRHQPYLALLPAGKKASGERGHTVCAR